jgi:hypothetical protein
MMHVPQPSKAVQQLVYLKRLRDLALTLTQDQLDAVGWIVGAQGTTPAELAGEYAPYIARLQGVVDAERAEEDRVMEDLGRLRKALANEHGD